MGEPETKDRYEVGNYGIGHWWGNCKIGNHIYFDLVGEPCPEHAEEK